MTAPLNQRDEANPGVWSKQSSVFPRQNKTTGGGGRGCTCPLSPSTARSSIPDGRPLVLVLAGACQSGTVRAGLRLTSFIQNVVPMSEHVRVVHVRQASEEQAKTRGAARSRGVRFALGAFGLCVCARRAGLQFMRERDRTRCMSMYVTRCMLWSSFF